MLLPNIVQEENDIDSTCFQTLHGIMDEPPLHTHQHQFQMDLECWNPTIKSLFRNKNCPNLRSLVHHLNFFLATFSNIDNQVLVREILNNKVCSTDIIFFKVSDFDLSLVLHKLNTN